MIGPMSSALRLGLLAGLVLTFPSAVAAQSATNVLLVVNAASPASVRIGEYYAERRGIPKEQVLQLSTLPAEPTDGIDRVVFERNIQAPIARWLNEHQAQDRILFIVLTKGIPLRINGGRDGFAASVDSELTLLYRRMIGMHVPLAGPLPNPYFLGERSLADARRFTRQDHTLYLVTRLDGFSVADVLALIDRGVAPSDQGRFILDGRSSWTDKGNEWLRGAADRLKAAGLSDDRVTFDGSSVVEQNRSDVLGYYSWGSNDPRIRQRTFGMKFRPGAIGGMFVSTDGRTFREPPADWKVGNWNDKDEWFAGSPQSLAGDLIREGITGVAGHVAEPRLGHTIRPDILFPAYVAGFTLVEAFYLAMPSVSWMTVVVGDPLCAPFAAKLTTSAGEPPPIDPATELPAIFSGRRLESASKTDAPREALQAYLRAENRDLRDDEAGAIADLERATALAPQMLVAQHLLAGKYEAAGQYERAIERYQAILKIDPNDMVALNNLAYGLATRRGELQQATELAERAYRLSPKAPAVIDTLGWILFMSGDMRRSLDLLGTATAMAPRSVPIGLHFVEALLTAGRVDDAKRQFERLRAVNPAGLATEEAKALEEKLR
jgi:uncharacterized protein (TIGR03790 family)